MERYLKATNATTSYMFSEDGVIVDPGTVTLTLTRADGTVIASAQSTAGAGAAARTFNLTAALHLNLLDTIRLDWLSATKGTQTSYVEVVGGFLFSIAEARALKPLDDDVTYPAAAVAAARAYAEVELERACGVAFVPRYRNIPVSGDGRAGVVLPVWPVRAIRSVSVIDSAGASTAYTAGQLAALRFDGELVYNPAGWASGVANFVIGVEHGLDFPPPGATESALLLAKQKIVRGPVDDRATQRPSEFGPINLATAGMFGSLFGIPTVDAFVKATRVPAVA